jgi:integrase
MANGEKKLTALAVRNAKPGTHGDGGSLFLVVSKSGQRKWVWRYRSGSRIRDMGLGDAEYVSLTEARAQRDDWRRKLAMGRDPIETRRATTMAGTTFGTVAEEVIALKTRDLRNTKSAAQWAMTLTKYAKPLRDKPVAGIDTAAVLVVLKPLWTRVPETASRLRGRIERVLDHARTHGHIPADAPNPARWRGHLELLLGNRKRLIRGHHAAMAYTDVAAFMKWLRAKSGASAKALEWTILTAARTGETIRAVKDEIDLEAAVWTIPKQRMKAARDHRVPLSSPAVAIAREIMTNPSKWLFPSGHGKPLSNMSMAMLVRDAYPDITVHGLRSAFRDWAGDRTEFPREVIEAALSHAVGDEVERAYRRGDALERRRELMRAWAAYLV